jgi:hypothetical protein
MATLAVAPASLALCHGSPILWQRHRGKLLIRYLQHFNACPQLQRHDGDRSVATESILYSCSAPVISNRNAITPASKTAAGGSAYHHRCR